MTGILQTKKLIFFQLGRNIRLPPDCFVPYFQSCVLTFPLFNLTMTHRGQNSKASFSSPDFLFLLRAYIFIHVEVPGVSADYAFHAIPKHSHFLYKIPWHETPTNANPVPEISAYWTM